MLEIEIIPWEHSFNKQAHADVVSYVKSLPKNSVLALEINPQELATTQKYMDALTSVRGQATLPLANTVQLALAELLLECSKKNIQIVPIRSIASSRSSKLKETKLGPLVHTVDLFPDHAFVRELKAALHKFKQKRLVVVVGFGHAGMVQGLLQLQGVSSRIHFEHFSNPDLMKAVANAAYVIKQAFIARDLSGVQHFSRIFNNLAKQLKPRGNDLILRQQFLKTLIARSQEQMKRQLSRKKTLTASEQRLLREKKQRQIQKQKKRLAKRKLR
ncbi:MAG: hypothetical protein Q7S92_00960 [Candidatus Diapherotrites archaeon]|nr:hypothetical protein [Candidatus Diapherotrites archaeon]